MKTSMAKSPIPTSQWKQFSGRFFGGNVHNLKCVDDDVFRRPDHVKFQYATFSTDFEPGAAKYAQMERNIKRGLLHEMPEIVHWSLEEYFWHGVPGDNWHPLEAYLDFVGDWLSESGKAQLRQWKEARLSVWRIGPVQGEAVSLNEWDIKRRTIVGEPIKAISLAIGGVSQFRDLRGHVMFSYISPWQPAENLYCSMGYSTMPDNLEDADVYSFILGFRKPEIITQPLPWKTSLHARHRYLRDWRQRDWLNWLGERLQFPFRALFPHPVTDRLRVATVTELLITDQATSRQIGIHVRVSGVKGIDACGLSNLTVLDFESPSSLPVAEYREYRRLVGPPPQVRGQRTIQFG